MSGTCPGPGALARPRSRCPWCPRRVAFSQVASGLKFGAGANKQHQTHLNTKVLDEDHENLKHKSVSDNMKKQIIEARLAKKWTQVGATPAAPGSIRSCLLGPSDTPLPLLRDAGPVGPGHQRAASGRAGVRAGEGHSQPPSHQQAQQGTGRAAAPLKGTWSCWGSTLHATNGGRGCQGGSSPCLHGRRRGLLLGARWVKARSCPIGVRRAEMDIVTVASSCH